MFNSILTITENGGDINWGISDWIKSRWEIFQSRWGGEKFLSQQRRGILDVDDLICQPESVRLFFIMFIMEETHSFDFSQALHVAPRNMKYYGKYTYTT